VPALPDIDENKREKVYPVNNIIRYRRLGEANKSFESLGKSAVQNYNSNSEERN